MGKFSFLPQNIIFRNSPNKLESHLNCSHGKKKSGKAFDRSFKEIKNHLQRKTEKQTEIPLTPNAKNGKRTGKRTGVQTGLGVNDKNRNIVRLRRVHNIAVYFGKLHA